MRSETKIFNEWYFKKYGGIISIGTMTGAVLKSWVRKGFDAGWQHRQTEVDELQRRNHMLNDNVKEQGQKLVYQNEVIETQAEKLLGLRDEKAELQKRLDAALEVIMEYYTGSYDESPDLVVDLEQALKGGTANEE